MRRRFLAVLLTSTLCVGLFSYPVSATEISEEVTEDVVITESETPIADETLEVEDIIENDTELVDEDEQQVLEEDVTQPVEPETSEEDILGEEEGLSLSGFAHIQTKGDTDATWDGNMLTLGTTGQGKRVEAISLNINGVDGLGISYRTYVQTYGWGSFVDGGVESGTRGQAKRIEAIEIKLTGEKADDYSVYYRVHAQTFGWMDWAKNGETAGSLGFAKRLECIQIIVVANDEYDLSDASAEQVMLQAKTGLYRWDCGTMCPEIILGKVSDDKEGKQGFVNYTTHVQTYGDQNWVSDGSVSGTFGESKRLESIKIKLGNTGYSGDISYRTHVQKYGWGDWVSNGTPSGTTGEAKRLEAIQIKLEGEVAEHYNVYYRVHCQKLGWMGWTSNGEIAGTSGYAFRLEGIQIMLMPKDSWIMFPDCVRFSAGEYWKSYLDGTGGCTGPVKCGLDHLGLKYLWAGEDWSKGVDCSGFTKMCYKGIGINLPHNSDMQGRCGREVQFSELKAGDLIVYPSDKFFAASGGHVAMYMGSGMMIESSGNVHISEAPSSGKNLKFVRIVN